MLVPDEVRKCVAFVYCQGPDGRHPIGTAFVLSSHIAQTNRAWPVIVTAKHLLARVRQHSTDGVVHLRLNLNDGGTDWLEAPLQYWRTHPTDDTIDAAVLPYMPADKFDFRPFALESSVTPELIGSEGFGIGDEVFIVGLFVNHFGKQRNIPIVRTGNIAAMPEERVATANFGSIEAYLIESRSIGGISGAPVFAHKSSVRTLNESLVITADDTGLFRFLGLVHGHFDVKATNEATLTSEKINMGIAMIVPATKIIETINQPELLEMKNKQRPNST